MALDTSQFVVCKGTMTYTPSGGAQALGFSVLGFDLAIEEVYEEVLTEEWGESPADYIDVGGRITISGELYQWDAATRNALGPQNISTNDFIMTTSRIGQLASAQSVGTLAFVPDATGQMALACSRVVVISGQASQLNVPMRRKRVSSFRFAFASLPDTANSNRQLRLYRTS